MTVFIVEDETYARTDLSKHISGEFRDELQISGMAGDVGEASRMIPELNPDILLLDVDLPDGTAFDILRNLGHQVHSHLIFITAYDHFAIRAIKFSALDYILKPWNPEELNEALRKALKLENHENTSTGMEVLSAREKTEKIALKTSEKIFLVKINEIIRLESDGNYTRFFLGDGNQILISKTLKEYDDLLSPSGFFRVHQSHLVNINHIESFHRLGGGSLYMADHSEVPVSQRKKEKLTKLLNSYSPGKPD